MSNWYCDNLDCDWSGETNPTTLHGFCPKCLANCSKAVQKCPINGTVYHPKHKSPSDHPEATLEQLALVLRGGEFQLSLLVPDDGALTLGRAIEHASRELPSGYILSFSLTSERFATSLTCPDSSQLLIDSSLCSFDQIDLAVELACGSDLSGSVSDTPTLVRDPILTAQKTSN